MSDIPLPSQDHENAELSFVVKSDWLLTNHCNGRTRYDVVDPHGETIITCSGNFWGAQIQRTFKEKDGNLLFCYFHNMMASIIAHGVKSLEGPYRIRSGYPKDGIFDLALIYQRIELTINDRLTGKLVRIISLHLEEPPLINPTINQAYFVENGGTFGFIRTKRSWTSTERSVYLTSEKVDPAYLAAMIIFMDYF